MNSLARVMEADITIPDFSSITLPRHILTKAMEPGSIVIVDSTGLKIYGKDEWHQEKHMFLLGVPGVDCILRLMKIITFWHVNSLRHK
jgi:hypothetical protein